MIGLPWKKNEGLGHGMISGTESMVDESSGGGNSNR